MHHDIDVGLLDDPGPHDTPWFRPCTPQSGHRVSGPPRIYVYARSLLFDSPILEWRCRYVGLALHFVGICRRRRRRLRLTSSSRETSSWPWTRRKSSFSTLSRQDVAGNGSWPNLYRSGGLYLYPTLSTECTVGGVTYGLRPLSKLSGRSLLVVAVNFVKWVELIDSTVC